jgi:hypothetical protein
MNSFRRSLRNIDLTFTNFSGVKGETLQFRISDHWPLIYRSEHINFAMVTNLPSTNGNFLRRCFVSDKNFDVNNWSVWKQQSGTENIHTF